MNTETLHLVSAVAVVIAVAIWVLMATVYAWRSERTVREALDLNEQMWARNDELMGLLTSAMNLLVEQRKATEAAHEQQ